MTNQAIDKMIGHPVTVRYDAQDGSCVAFGELLSFDETGALLAAGMSPSVITFIPRERVLFVKRENAPQPTA